MKGQERRRLREERARLRAQKMQALRQRLSDFGARHRIKNRAKQFAKRAAQGVGGLALAAPMAAGLAAAGTGKALYEGARLGGRASRYLAGRSLNAGRFMSRHAGTGAKYVGRRGLRMGRGIAKIGQYGAQRVLDGGRYARGYVNGGYLKRYNQLPSRNAYYERVHRRR